MAGPSHETICWPNSACCRRLTWFNVWKVPAMASDVLKSPSRRQFFGTAAFGVGALAGLTLSELASAAPGRVTDTVRITWGLSGLNMIAKERGEFAKLLAKDGIKIEWLGPFPNHAP